METFVDIISDIGAQISKIKRCRINQQTLFRKRLNEVIIRCLASYDASLTIG